MDAYLRALRTDPRFAACVATILLLLADDVPERSYGTFRDPGCALLLSITYGNCIGLIVVRRDVRTTTRRSLAGLLLVALPVKYLAQAALYVRNATEIDTALFLAAHACIAVQALPDHRFQPILIRVAVSSMILVLATFLIGLEYGYARSRNLGFTSDFFTYAAARAVVPYIFWTAVLAVGRFSLPPAD